MSPNNPFGSYICLVHYHEVGLKGRNRYSFERKLKENLIRSLSGFEGTEVSRISGRLEVSAPTWEALPKIADRLAKHPGVVRVSYGLRLKQDMEQVQSAALWLLEQNEPYVSFKVDARRANTTFPINSMELNQVIGAWLCAKLPDKKVKMIDPDARVHVEMIEGSAYLYINTVKGVGGLPVGTAGAIVSLLSAGLDSPVATWRLIKRGAKITALHFSGRPQTTDTSEHLVKEIVSELNISAGIERLCIVPFGDVQYEIAALVPPSLRVIFYRMMMIEVANRLAMRFGAKAIATGESLGQVASQTLDNIYVVNSVAKYPVLRPLIGTDKLEIIGEAERLGTYEISSQNHDDCCTLFMPRNPETHAKLSEVDKVWQSLMIEKWLQDIEANMEIIEYV